MLKPIKFTPPNPERRDPNFERFEEQIKHRSKRELVYMCFLAVEALAVRDAADKKAFDEAETALNKGLEEAKAGDPKETNDFKHGT